MLFTNENNIDLSVAVWLASNEYDTYTGDGKYLSVTELLKPTKQLVLGKRADTVREKIDINSFIHSKLGTAIHNSIEYVWSSPNLYKPALRKLGYPKNIIDRIKVNPVELKKNDIPIYMEKRSYKKIGGYTIGGKFDFIGNGFPEDFKSMKVYGYQKGDKIEEFRHQLSIYRWLNPEIITQDIGKIQYILTDWSKGKSKAKNFPSSAITKENLQLLTIEETEKFIIEKLAEIDKFKTMHQDEMPACTKEELWQQDTVYKYFTKPENIRASKSTKDYFEMTEYINAKGKPNGIMKTFPGEVKKCGYCNGKTICNQKITLEELGLYKPE